MGKVLPYTSFTMFRNVISVPDTYRAFHPRKKPTKRQIPEPEPSLVARIKQLKSLGFDAELRYEKLAQSYYVAYKLASDQKPPEWEVM